MPVAYPLALVVALALLVLSLRPSAGVGTASTFASALIVLGVPWVLAPWWLLDRVQDPATWWWEAGLADAGVGTLDPGAVGLALGQPGGPGDAVSVWLGAGVVVAALLALARADARGVVLPAWCVGVLGLVLAAVGAGRTVELPVGTVPVWVGFCLVVWWGALLVAAAAGAADLRDLLTGRSFGLSQPVVALTLVAAVVGPVLALAAVVSSGLDGPLQRSAPVPVPSYMADDATTGARPSTLVLADGPDDSLTSTVVRADGWRLGEEPYAAASGQDACHRRARRPAGVAPHRQRRGDGALRHRLPVRARPGRPRRRRRAGHRARPGPGRSTRGRPGLAARPRGGTAAAAGRS